MGEEVTGSQTAEGDKLVVNCKVYSAVRAGQRRTIWFPTREVSKVGLGVMLILARKTSLEPPKLVREVLRVGKFREAVSPTT
jgi:hypothetical protein